MLRSPSPFMPPPEGQNPYMPQSYSPIPSSSITPGTVVYTTSTGPDGRILYYPFKQAAVPASYQTANGIVNGIQWVPAEATSIVPPGAQPANADFAASWNRRREDKNYEKWARDEEKRRKKEEKEAKRLREQPSRGDPDTELRKARERDAQYRDRRKSINAGSGNYPFPSSGGYSTSTSPYSGHNDRAGYPTTSPYMRDRKYSGNYSDMERQLSDLDLDRNRDHPSERERKLSSYGRSRGYSTSEGGERARAISGNLGNRPDAYGGAGIYGAPSGPYKYSASATGRASPNIRGQDIPTYPGANYSSSPARTGSDAYPRSTTPFGGPAPMVYPRGHVLEGQPIPHSRAASPIPGAGYASRSASPHMPGPIAFPSEPPKQLAAPECFSRSINAAQPYTPFDVMKVQDMNRFWTELPRMPIVLLTHDVQDDDWRRLMEDLALAWANKLPVPQVVPGGPPPKRTSLVAELLTLWNNSFFAVRGIELILYRGRERRSGAQIGRFDRDLPYFDDADDFSSPSSSSDELSDTDEDSDSDYARHDPTLIRAPAHVVDVFEAGRRRREAKRIAREERKRRQRERRIMRRRKQRERRYAIFARCVNIAPGHHPGTPAMTGGYSASATGGYGRA